MNAAEKLAAELRGSKILAAQNPPAANPNSWAGSANRDAERQRVAGIVQRLQAWADEPTLPTWKIAELTGLSRERIVQLAERGAIQRRDGELVFATVQQHFANRASKLSAADKSRSRALPK